MIQKGAYSLLTLGLNTVLKLVAAVQTVLSLCRHMQTRQPEVRIGPAEFGRTAQPTPERETHHFRRVPDFGSPPGKRLADAYRRITHHFGRFDATWEGLKNTKAQPKPSS